MATTLSLLNYGANNIAELTSLSADVAAAATTFTATNPNMLAADDWIVVGARGHEQCELRRVSTVSGTTVTVTAAFTFAHKQNEEVAELRGNQVRIYRAANVDGTAPATAAFALLATTTIDEDQLATIYIDSTGSSDYWYRQTYYHSVSAAETALADSASVRGADYGHYATLEEIRSESGFQASTSISDQKISDRRDDAESQINSVLRSARYTLPLDTVPAVIKNVTKILASAYLLIEEYGSGAEGTNKDGYTKKGLADGILADILSGRLVLLDQEYSPLARTSSGFEFWPDDTTEDASEDDAGGPRAVTMLKKF